jgi:hypothetical protein
MRRPSTIDPPLLPDLDYRQRCDFPQQEVTSSAPQHIIQSQAQRLSLRPAWHRSDRACRSASKRLTGSKSARSHKLYAPPARCGHAISTGTSLLDAMTKTSPHNGDPATASSGAASAEPAAASDFVVRAYARLAACAGEHERIAAAAHLILAIFDEFYGQLCEYPYRAKRAFETMDTHASIRISSERLGLYSRYIAEHGPKILAAFPALSNNARYWDELDQLFVAMIVDRYEADTAFSFAHSLRRNIDHGIWRPVAYSFPPPSKRRAYSMAAVHRRLPVPGRIDVALLCTVYRCPASRWRSET